MADKYHPADVEYAPNEAEYDAADFQYHIVDHSADIIAMFPDKEMRDRVLKLLNDSESGEQGHADQALRGGDR